MSQSCSGRQRNVLKSVLHVKKSCFVHKTNCFLTLSLLKVPFVDLWLCSQSSQLSLRRTPLVPTPSVCLRESQIKGVKNGRDQLWVSVLPRCSCYRESNQGSKERQGPTLGVRLTEVSVLLRVKSRESRKAGTNSGCPFNRGVRLIESQIKGVKKGRDQLQVSV